MSLLKQHYEEKPEHWPYGLSVSHFGPENIFLVKEANTGEAIGWVGWQELKEGDKKIGYYSVGINSDKRGQGFGEAAVKNLIAKKAAGVDEVRALVVESNISSKRLADKIGVPVDLYGADGKISKAARYGSIIQRVVGGVVPAWISYANSEGKGKSEMDRWLQAGLAGAIGTSAQHTKGSFNSRALSLATPAGVVALLTGAQAGADKVKERGGKVVGAMEDLTEKGNNMFDKLESAAPWLLTAAGLATVATVGSEIYAARKRQQLAEKLLALEKTMDRKDNSVEDAMTKEAKLKDILAVLGAVGAAHAGNMHLTRGAVFPQSAGSQAELSQIALPLNLGGDAMAGVAASKFIKGRSFLPAVLQAAAIGVIPAASAAAVHSRVVKPVIELSDGAKPLLEKTNKLLDKGNAIADFWKNLNLASKIGIVAFPAAGVLSTLYAANKQDESINTMVDYIKERERRRLGDMELPEEKALRKIKELASEEIPGTEGMPTPWREGATQKTAARSLGPGAKSALGGLGGLIFSTAMGNAPDPSDGWSEDDTKKLVLALVGGATGASIPGADKKTKMLLTGGLLGERLLGSKILESDSKTNLNNMTAEEIKRRMNAPAPSPAAATPAASSQPVAKWLIGGGLGLGALALAAAALGRNKYQPEPSSAAGTSVDLSGLDLSKLDLEKLRPYAGPRIKVTLPTRNPGDAETQVDIPAPGISEIYMSQDMQRGIKRDIRRRLLAESRSRTRRPGQQLEELAAVEEI